jgi:tripartite ATP-independent transporter DctP family solute receptor
MHDRGLGVQMMGTWTRRELLMGAAGSAGVALAGPAIAVPGRQLVSSDVHVDGYPTVAAVRWLADELARESGGRLAMRVYHSGQLGRESDAIDLVRNGVIDLTRVHSSVTANAVPATRALGLPFAIDSTAHLRRVVDGVPGETVLAALAARGLVGLAIYDAGARCIYNTSRPVVRPADLAGLKLRVPPSDLFIDMMRAFGANPTPLSYSETYSALQTRLIDGAENNWSSFRSSRHFEVARYWSLTGHSYAPDLLMISARTFESLDPRDRDLLRDLARRSVVVMRQRWDEQEQQSRTAALAAGVTEVEVDQSAFRMASQTVLERHLRAPGVADLYARIRALA